MPSFLFHILVQPGFSCLEIRLRVVESHLLPYVLAYEGGDHAVASIVSMPLDTLLATGMSIEST